MVKQACITVSKDKTMVKANTKNAAFQMYNEGIISIDEIKPIKIDQWYKIDGSYGQWVLDYEFPNTKCDEFIDVKYEQ